MTLLDVYPKRMPNGKIATMALIQCACERKFRTSLSRWNQALFDSCRDCGLKRAKNQGYGVFNGGRNLGR